MHTFSMFKTITTVCLFCAVSISFPAISQTKTPSIESHDAFFDSLKALCGKAFEGEVIIDNAPSDGFTDRPLIMHVMTCTDSQLHIPFHVGENASRTWVITKTGSGLSLKHDHRHKDGSEDQLTQYGGHTLDRGWPQVQSFPADSYSKDMFVEQGIPQSNDNVWQIYIYPDTFSYRLVRNAREFRVDFDLTKPVAAPNPPWGYPQKD